MTHKTKQMQASVAFFSVLEAVDDDLVFVELTLFDRHVDLDNVLPDDATSSNVQVAVKL